jgi:gamma-glutamyltranspeptidase/glutathione hydrolase
MKSKSFDTVVVVAMKTGNLPQGLMRAGRFVLLVWWWALAATARGEMAKGEHGMVATTHPLATAAGIEALNKGGNAIDAAVAAALTLGVVEGPNCGLGGGCLMLIRLANGSIVAIDGRETAPAAATREMFVRHGKAVAQLSRSGALAAGVPGAVAACDYAVAHYGKLRLKQQLLPAARLAADGFIISRAYAARLKEAARELNRFPAARAIFLHADGRPKTAGEVLQQPDLARTYRAIAEHGAKWFYGGPFAEAAAQWMRENGGRLTEADFANYHVKLREPISTSYRGFQIVGFPPPSSGGILVAQILNLLEPFDLQALGAGSADFIHVAAEAMKLAFADRAYWLGDADFAKVPRGLVAKDYAARLARQIRMDKAGMVEHHGAPDQAQETLFGEHTTHLATADAEGNWVACTATVNTSFGCKVVVPGTGVVLNNQMDDFTAQAGAANYFGLVGAEANAVAPGKRPLSCMAPTLVLKDGQPILAVGAAGGPTIISQVVLAIVNVVDFKMDLDQALAQPRFHHQWRPAELKLEPGISTLVREELERRGHKLKPAKSIGATQAVGRGPAGNGFVGVHDPRVEGKAEGW